MRSETFRDCKTGEQYTRIQKRTALKLFLDGKKIGMIASNMNPFSSWNYPIYAISKESRKDFAVDDLGFKNDFNNLVNSFSFYNCTNETGRYINFYLIEEV